MTGKRRPVDMGPWLEAQDKLSSLAAAMREDGFSPREVHYALHGLNGRRKTHGQAELKVLVRDTYSSNGNGPKRPNGVRVPSRQGAKPQGLATGTPQKLRRLDVAWMAKTKPPEPDFLVEQIVAAGEVTVLWGAPGIGKSLCSEAFTRGVALGEPVAGLECRRGRVLYLDAENGEYEIHRRVRGLGLPSASVAIYDASASVHLVSDFDAIHAVVAAEKPDMLVLDSLRRLTPGSEENDSGAMAEAIGSMKALAQEFKCGVLVIHHARKDGGEYRGSSAIRDQVSISWQLARSGDTDRSHRVLRNDKMRIGPEPGALYLSIVHGGGTIGIRAADEPAPGEHLASGRKTAEVAEQILEVLEQHPSLTRPAIAKTLGRTPRDGTVRRALEDMQERGFVLYEEATGTWQRGAS